jgi:hypothetical protein
MDAEIIEFWQRNKTPIGLMVQSSRPYGITPQQVERAAQIVYEEVQEIIYNVPEIYPYTNGTEYARIILLRNHLKPNRLGWRVHDVAKRVKATDYDSELMRSKKRIRELEDKIEKKSIRHRFRQWLKNINWEIPEWQ